MKIKHLIVATLTLASVLTGTGRVVADETALPYVVHEGRRIPGTDVRADRHGQIILTTPAGRMTFEPGTRVVVAEPTGFQDLRRKVEESQYEEVISGLREIIEQYRFLGWDHRARRLLGRALTGIGRYQDAVTHLESLFEEDPGARAEPDVQEAYLLALEGAREHDKLLPMLDEVIRQGGRQPAARAQMIRGNLRMEEGEIEKALYDFLRTATLFRTMIEFQPEALYRAAVCYEQLGQSEKAQRFIERLQTEFPESDYAQRDPRDP